MSPGAVPASAPHDDSPSRAEIAARFRRDLSGVCASGGDADEGFAVDGKAPAIVAHPSSAEEVVAAVRLAENLGAAIIPFGSGTHVHVGNLPARYDVALSTAEMAGVLQHNAPDMTVTVSAGMTLESLAEVLREAGQWLPLDPPWPEAVTVGGLIAADLNGGLRSSHGKVRDYLIGLRAVIGAGDLVRGGGQVVKNVAGYDIPKLMTGSFGTLGVIVEATFKVRPLPPADLTVALPEVSMQGAFERVDAIVNARVAPWTLDVIDAAAANAVGLGSRPHVLARFGGEAPEVHEQLDRLANVLAGSERLPQGVAAQLRNFPLQGPGSVAVRLSLLPKELPGMLEAIEAEARAFGAIPSMVVHAASGVARLRIEAEGNSPGIVPFLHWLRFATRQRRGYAFVEQLPVELKREIDVWGPSPLLDLMRGVKRAFDPKDVFSPGRFIGRI